jgi:branched-chain amino acid aminotransferase
MAAPFPGTGKIWMNGSLVDWADAKIHIGSHVIHYGSGVFEGARCYDTPRGSACFRLDAHLNRLFDSAKIYRMEPKESYAELHKAVMDTIKANDFKACYIRPLVYRGYHTLGVNPFPCPVDTAIMLWEWGTYLGQDALTNGVDVRVSSWARSAPNTFPTLAKTSANYANSSLIKMEAVAEGYSEGIALDTFGYLSEGSGQNLFVVRSNVIYTPPVSASILPGITRDSVITIARDLGFTVREEMLPRELLYIADEAFFAGTAVEITPIKSVDKIAMGNGRRGPITEALQQSFFDIINGRVEDKHGWLEFVYEGEPRQAVGAGTGSKGSKGL